MHRSLILIASLVLPATTLSGQEAWLDQAANQRWASGTYSYREISTGAENGSEDFLLVVGHDGTRTLRATNAFGHDMEIWRHVVYRVDADFRPLDLYMNYTADGAWRGSGFFVIDNQSLHATLNGPLGRESRKFDVPEEFSLIPHPIASNSWPTWYYDKDRGGSQPVTMYSFDGLAKDGDGMLGEWQQQTIRFEGTETVTVPAGEFETDRYVFNDSDPVLFLHGPDRLIVRMQWALADSEYVLTRYQTGPMQGEELK